MTPLSKLQKRHDNSHACWKKAACSMLEQSKTARESKKKKKSFLLSCQYPRNKITADKVKVNIGHEIT